MLLRSQFGLPMTPDARVLFLDGSICWEKAENAARARPLGNSQVKYPFSLTDLVPAPKRRAVLSARPLSVPTTRLHPASDSDASSSCQTPFRKPNAST